jgi:cell division protein FtsL
MTGWQKFLAILSATVALIPTLIALAANYKKISESTTITKLKEWIAVKKATAAKEREALANMSVEERAAKTAQKGFTQNEDGSWTKRGKTISAEDM